MISKFFLTDESFRVLSKMLGVENSTIIEDMKVLTIFLLSQESMNDPHV